MKAPSPSCPLPGIVAIAATYVFFLLFAEFALLHLMEARASSPGALRLGLVWLGGGGVLGSLLAARFAGRSPASAITLGFLTCGAAAVLAASLPGRIPLEAVAALTGLGLGWLTVNVAGNLHRLFAGAPLGLCTGAGTGLAYAFCNVPAVFTTSPTGHAWISAGACALGVLASSLLAALEPVAAGPPSSAAGARSPFWMLLAACTALVWLDSAAFLLIQERPELRALTWATSGQLWTNAAVHLAAALLGGWLLDRGLLRLVLTLAGAGLLVASFTLAHGGPAATRWHLLYPVGVSLYSTALVALPALTRRPPGGVGARARAAWLYILAGWIGSALGIGMALDQRTIPDGFLLAAGVALAVMLLGSLRGRSVAASAGLVLLCLPAPRSGAADRADPTDASTIAAGRAVYIAEGCIHCHSQFVRPGTNDELLWGPSRPLAEMLKEEPPLPGNRRQGPDLQNVGNRRSPDWNRLHLQAPRTLAPGSAMPRYAHLFRSADPRGEALVAYLASLGSDTTEARARQIADWTPPTVTDNSERGAKLFGPLCASCHGDDARGRGPLAAKLALPPADLVSGPRPRTTRDTAALTHAALARVIRFGIPGTAMAGHETLSDADVAALSAFVGGLKLRTAAEVQQASSGAP
ncbi:MAG: cbb3-type cytochrome c oxidase subunit II [Opitutaceae bacterium]|nr:cbb3-type cytochrome c oxidase subunit II [Opitutaceae bacterium]